MSQTVASSARYTDLYAQQLSRYLSPQASASSAGLMGSTASVLPSALQRTSNGGLLGGLLNTIGSAASSLFGGGGSATPATGNLLSTQDLNARTMDTLINNNLRLMDSNLAMVGLDGNGAMTTATAMPLGNASAQLTQTTLNALHGGLV